MVLRRSQIEANITAVAQGRRSKEAVLQEAVEAFTASFAMAQQRQGGLLYVDSANHCMSASCVSTSLLHDMHWSNRYPAASPASAISLQLLGKASAGVYTAWQ